MINRQSDSEAANSSNNKRPKLGGPSVGGGLSVVRPEILFGKTPTSTEESATPAAAAEDDEPAAATAADQPRPPLQLANPLALLSTLSGGFGQFGKSEEAAKVSVLQMLYM